MTNDVGISRTVVDFSQDVVNTLRHRATLVLQAEGVHVPDLRINPYQDHDGSMRVIMNLRADEWQVFMTLVTEALQRRLNQTEG